jgi:dihydroorotate dehydrogenase
VFGFVEVGSATPRLESGNLQPRPFWLEPDRAAQPHGLNNGVRRWRRGCSGRAMALVLGINLGKNKETEDAAADRRDRARRPGPLADYMVINVCRRIRPPALRRRAGANSAHPRRALLEARRPIRRRCCQDRP